MPNIDVGQTTKNQTAKKQRLGLKLGLGLLVLAVLAAGAWPLWKHSRAAYCIYAGQRALHQAQAERALALVQTAVDLRPGSAEAQYWCGVANRRAGHLEPAAEHFAEAERLGWSKKLLKRQRLMAQMQSGKIDQTEPAIRKLLASELTDDDAEEIYECLVKSYLSEYRLREAKRAIDYWIQWKPEALQPRFWRAEIAEFIDDRDKQIAEYEAILEVDPDNFEAHLMLGTIYNAENKVAEALEHYERCRKLRPTSGGPALGAASCLRRLGKLAEAKRELVNVDPSTLEGKQRPYWLFETAQIEIEERNYADAVVKLEEAVELAPSDPAFRYALGNVLAKGGRRNEAKEQLDRSKYFDRNIVRLSDLQHDVIDRPRDAGVRYEIGVLLREQGYAKESAAWLTSALRCDPTHRDAHRVLAEYYEEVGNHEAAAKHRRLGSI